MIIGIVAVAVTMSIYLFIFCVCKGQNLFVYLCALAVIRVCYC